MKKYELLLIDLDGTILDFNKSEEEAIKQCFLNYGIEPNKENIKLYSEINDLMWKALERGEINQSDLKIARFSKFLEAIGRNEVDATAMGENFLTLLGEGKYLIDGALEFIKNLKQSHKIAYITNGISKVQRSRLFENPIADFADKVYISEDIGYSKPHPQMIYLALDEFNIDKSKALVIGDSETSDIQAGINAGVDSLYLNFKNDEPSKIANFTAFNYAEALNIICK